LAKVVAVLAANPALSSILTMVLAATPRLRVREFASAEALDTYMQIATIDLVVADFDSEEAPADQLAQRLRGRYEDFQIIALGREVTLPTRARAAAAGIDEVIAKPMSPRYLLERVLARLERRKLSSHRRIALSGNVVPLFAPRLVQP
jgi:two-component system, OmpR family, phosphate regulon response regulator PhoB